MAEFIYGTAINLALEDIILQANEYLWLISPYIKLHGRIKDELTRRKDNHQLEIVIVFGKNENDVSKSISMDDINFLKDFPNVRICYSKDLHAKFYANEDASLITSMNLHQFSQNTNIEAGVLLRNKSVLTSLANRVLDKADEGGVAQGYFYDVIEQSEKLFEKKPQYESKNFGFSEKYIESKVMTDNLNAFFRQTKSEIKPASSTNSTFQTTISKQSKIINGYCIRTGAPIPFNPQRPLSDSAYESWKKFGNKDYPEKYCHYSGEASNGETSVSKPILKKNWIKAKELMH